MCLKLSRHSIAHIVYIFEMGDHLFVRLLRIHKKYMPSLFYETKRGQLIFMRLNVLYSSKNMNRNRLLNMYIRE